jgi:hypothetical protein
MERKRTLGRTICLIGVGGTWQWKREKDSVGKGRTKRRKESGSEVACGGEEMLYGMSLSSASSASGEYRTHPRNEILGI